MSTTESPDTVKTDPLLAEILAVLEEAGVSRTGFGFRAAGDPTLVNKMERGRQIKKSGLRAAIRREIAATRERAEARRALE